MESDLKKILTEISKDVIQLAREVMTSDVGINTKVNKNTLKDSDLYKQIESNVNDNIINILFNHYIVYIEWTRPPEYGKMPPVKAIIEWMNKKNIKPTNGNINQVAFLIARAIWRDGHDGRPIMETLIKQVENKWDKNYSIKLFDSIIKDLTDYFN